MDLRAKLAGSGFHEARTSTLVSAQDATWFGPAVELKNPFGDDQSRLRTSLLPGLLAALKRNLDHGTDGVRLFETGRVFSPGGEHSSLALVACGRFAEASWRQADARPWDVFDFKGAVARIAGLTEADFSPLPSAPEPFGAAIQVSKNGLTIGILGVLHPAEARKLNATMPILAASFDSAAWQTAASTPRATSPLPRFPASSRDVAFTAPLALAFGKVHALIASQNEPLLESVRLFDLFTDPSGNKLPKDKKSFAISLTFRSPERTLTAQEVTGATDRLKATLKSELGVDFRE